MSDDFSKFTAPHPSEELHQGVPVPVTFGMGGDGMPVPAAQPALDIPSALSEDTLVCMADTRSFVLRASCGSVYVSFEPSVVKRSASGAYYVEMSTMMAAVNAAYPDRELGGGSRENFTSLPWGLQCGFQLMRGGSEVTVATVEPVRPECIHYLRLQSDISADRERRFLVRSCMKQQSESGEYTSVGDAVIAACNVRYPRHLESEAILDEFDRKQIEAGRKKQDLGSFDIEKELAAEGGGLGVLG